MLLKSNFAYNIIKIRHNVTVMRFPIVYLVILSFHLSELSQLENTMITMS